MIKNFMKLLDENNFPIAGMDNLIFKTKDDKIHYGKYDFINYRDMGFRRWKEYYTNNIYESHEDVVEWIDSEEVIKEFEKDIQHSLLDKGIHFIMIKNVSILLYNGLYNNIIDEPLYSCIIKNNNPGDEFGLDHYIDIPEYDYYRIEMQNIDDNVYLIYIIEKDKLPIDQSH